MFSGEKTVKFLFQYLRKHTQNPPSSVESESNKTTEQEKP